MAKEIVEIETKIGVRDLRRLEGDLEKFGAQFDKKQGRDVLSVNVFVDLGGILTEKGQLLRIRQLRRLETGQVLKTLLTSKGAKLDADKVFKRKPERNLEVELLDGTVEDLVKLFQLIGFEIGEWLEYTILSRWVWKGVEIMFKQLPFLGLWMELEGSEAEIREVFEFLELDINKATSKRYEELLDKHCAEKGIPFDLSHFTFDYERQILSQQG